MLLCANRRVINCSQIPSSLNRFAIFLVGFAPFRAISQFIAKYRYTMQNFDFAPFHRFTVKYSLRSG